MSKPRKSGLCLGFDGVLVLTELGKYRAVPGQPVDGAMAFLVEAVDVFEVAIHSSRSRYWGGRRAMRRWLERQLADYLWTTSRTPQAWAFTHADYEEHYALAAQAIVRRISFPLWKPPAHVMIDDRAITFTGTWPSMGALRAFKPWNRREVPFGPAPGVEELIAENEALRGQIEKLRPETPRPAPRHDDVFMRGTAWLDEGGGE